MEERDDTTSDDVHGESPGEPGATALESLTTALATRAGRALVLGKPGRGKSTFVSALVAGIGARGARASLLAADPGQPLRGPPACFSLAPPAGTARELALGFLGSLDPLSVRLTALGELARLARTFEREHAGASLVVDACGLVATAVGREWALRQVEAIAATSVVLLERGGELEPLARLLRGRALELRRVAAAPEARPHGPEERRRRRTERLGVWLEGSATLVVSRDVPLLGTPERGFPDEDGRGRLVGVVGPGGETLAVGRIEGASPEGFRLRVSPPLAPGTIAALRVGDAACDPRGAVERRPFPEAPEPPPEGAFEIRARPVHDVDPVALAAPAEPFALPGSERAKRAPGFQLHFPNGLFGDPLVHVRALRERDSVLLDLGRASSLPTKLLHRVGLVLLSHAHMDHFFGFDELLRSLLGTPRTVRIVGPPGTADRIAGRVSGYTWNLIVEDLAAPRVAGRAGPPGPPRFRVAELRGENLHETEIVPGSQPRPLGETPAPGGRVHSAERFTARAVALEHRDITSLAYAIEERPRLAIRPEVLAARGLAGGPWIDRLKRAVLAAARGAGPDRFELPGGESAPVADLARDLLVEREGQRIVYVTDAADSPSNRAKIAGLAREADLFVCEATFTREDEARARDTAHLPAFAAAELARAAGVGRLVPFHLSPRYEDEPEKIFRELLQIFPRVQVPRSLQGRLRP